MIKNLSQDLENMLVSDYEDSTSSSSTSRDIYDSSYDLYTTRYFSDEEEEEWEEYDSDAEVKERAWLRRERWVEGDEVEVEEDNEGEEGEDEGFAAAPAIQPPRLEDSTGSQFELRSFDNDQR